MSEGKLKLGVLHGLIRNIFGGGDEDKLVSPANLQQACQSTRTSQTDQHEIKSLMKEVDALELTVGKLIVDRERGRGWHRARLKTIAKRHLLNMKKVKRDQWIRETKSLARYIATVKENDAGIAQEILLEFLPQQQKTELGVL